MEAIQLTSISFEIIKAKERAKRIAELTLANIVLGLFRRFNCCINKIK